MVRFACANRDLMDVYGLHPRYAPGSPAGYMNLVHNPGGVGIGACLYDDLTVTAGLDDTVLRIIRLPDNVLSWANKLVYAAIDPHFAGVICYPDGAATFAIESAALFAAGWLYLGLVMDGVPMDIYARHANAV